MTSSNQTMPALFVGHGSPLNALAENDYTKALNKLGATLPRPQVILCVSAHWLTEGTYVTTARQPRTIHDFYGFPEELYKVQYPAPGSPETGLYLHQQFPELNIKFDREEWGLDHGTWSVLKHIYPKADIPVVQLSLDKNLTAEQHFKLAASLQPLREKGVMILGSGNIVHNLRLISWEESAPVVDWAKDFDTWFKIKLSASFEEKKSELCKTQHPAYNKSVPTPEHYWPALYAVGASDQNDKLQYIYEGFQNASISMTSFMFSKLAL